MNSSENSSEETDQLEDADSSGGTRRSYECTFCRRGFTNAQALGGHMNIHRKDRAKAKHTSTPNNSSSLSNRLSNNIEESFASASPLSSSGQQSSRFYSIFEVQGNYNTYFQPSSATNPRNPSSGAAASYAFPFEYLNPRSHHRHRPVDVNHQELLGANLSLQIGPSHVETNHHQKEGEVDLELRLGHHHPY